MKTERRRAMNKPVFADLQRFDTPPEPGRLAEFLKATASGAPSVYPNGEPVEDAVETDPTDDASIEDEVGAEDTVALDTERYEDELKTLIGQLATEIETVQSDIDQQVTRATHALAVRLFPKLSEAFLAEEVTNQLPGLIPTPVARIELRADDTIAYRLNELLAETDLSERCEIIVEPAPSESRIHVSWGSGGVVFDFDGLLQACLARLQADQEDTGVLANVES